jgi:uncharacterized protein (DUF1800 family)
MRRRPRPQLLWLLVALPLFAACEPDRSLQEHILNRIGYGPDAWSRARIAEIGTQAYVEEQLRPETLDDSALEARIATLYPLTTWTLPQVRLTYNEYNADPLMGPGRPRQEMAAARMMRDVFSKKQLEQVLVDFWHNHFNVDARGETGRWGVVTYEREAIRPHVLGRFRDMLGAVAAHPSMLAYLDNDQNFIPGFIRGTTRFGSNENYARELLELHTVGVDAGYTLQDIQEIARAFTGWTINSYYDNGSFNFFEDSFQYLDAGHDHGAKSIMGSLYIPPGGGMSDGVAVLDFLAQHPATARFVSYKLVQRFVSETPPPALVDRAAARFLATDGDLREVMRTILLSPEFWSQAYRRQKLKRPQHFAASLSRAVGVADDAAWSWRIWTEVGAMGEDLYFAAPPTGYPETSAFWRGEGAFLRRTNVALWASYAMYGFGPLVSSSFASSPTALVADLDGRMVHGGMAQTTLDRLADFGAQIPEWTRPPEVASALLVTPEFLVH